MTRPNTNPTAETGTFTLAPFTETDADPARPEQLPQLRIWACYPTGSRPESVEITYDGPEPASAEFIAAIVTSLYPVAKAYNSVDTGTSLGNITASDEAIQRAAARAADKGHLR